MATENPLTSGEFIKQVSTLRVLMQSITSQLEHVPTGGDHGNKVWRASALAEVADNMAAQLEADLDKLTLDR